MIRFIHLSDYIINLDKVSSFYFDNSNLVITVYFINKKDDLDIFYDSCSSYSHAKTLIERLLQEC